MKLILLRHAKSSWDSPLLDDHARPLNDRGRKSAIAIGQWLKDQGHVPELVLCSDAARTRETHALLGLPEARCMFSNGLYLAPDGLLQRAIDDHPDVHTLMIIAHNPGLGDLAVNMAGDQLDDPALFAFPTGACLVLEGGKVVDFMVPRRLLGVESS